MRHMLTLIFAVLLIGVLCKIIGFTIKGAWGITKILFSVVFLPFVLITMVIEGLIYIALPILIIIGIISLIGRSTV